MYRRIVFNSGTKHHLGIQHRSDRCVQRRDAMSRTQPGAWQCPSRLPVGIWTATPCTRSRAHQLDVTTSSIRVTIVVAYTHVGSTHPEVSPLRLSVADWLTSCSNRARYQITRFARALGHAGTAHADALPSACSRRTQSPRRVRLGRPHALAVRVGDSNSPCAATAKTPCSIASVGPDEPWRSATTWIASGCRSASSTRPSSSRRSILPITGRRGTSPAPNLGGTIIDQPDHGGALSCCTARPSTMCR